MPWHRAQDFDVARLNKAEAHKLDLEHNTGVEMPRPRRIKTQKFREEPAPGRFAEWGFEARSGFGQGVWVFWNEAEKPTIFLHRYKTGHYELKTGGWDPHLLTNKLKLPEIEAQYVAYLLTGEFHRE